MKREIYYINTQHKLLKKWETSQWRLFFGFTLDIILLVAIFGILFILNVSGVTNLYLGGTGVTIVLELGILYIVFSVVKGLVEFHRFKNLAYTAIVKEQNNITIIKNLTWIDTQTLKQYIDKILDERNKNEFEYTDYKNCKLVKETKTYFEYIGEKNGFSSKFKIYKIYFNINNLNKEEN